MSVVVLVHGLFLPICVAIVSASAQFCFVCVGAPHLGFCFMLDCLFLTIVVYVLGFCSCLAFFVACYLLPSVSTSSFLIFSCNFLFGFVQTTIPYLVTGQSMK